jgi:extracellular elastinolytic metalloproteinase
MVDISGFSRELIVENKTFGNQHFLQLLIDGMKIQPCHPSFIQARNAIIAADKINYGGKYFCAIWKAFGKRGVGQKAVYSGHADDFTIPKECQ